MYVCIYIYEYVYMQRAGIVCCSVMPYVAVCCRVKVLQYHDGTRIQQSAQMLVLCSPLVWLPSLVYHIFILRTENN